MGKLKKLSIIIPVFNEKGTIRKILAKIEKVKIPLAKEIVIVDDASTDGTRKILQTFADKRNYRVVFKSENEGKGSALRKGFSLASGEVIAVQDADLEYDPADYPRLLNPILEEKTKVVYGSRWLGGKVKKTKITFVGKNRIAYLFFYLGGLIVTFLTNILYGTKITDEATGYKVFHRDVLKKIKLKSKGFEFCPEFTAKIIKNGFKIVEVPIRYAPRSISQGKKLKPKDGLKTIWALIKYRFID